MLPDVLESDSRRRRRKLLELITHVLPFVHLLQWQRALPHFLSMHEA